MHTTLFSFYRWNEIRKCYIDLLKQLECIKIRPFECLPGKPEIFMGNILAVFNEKNQHTLPEVLNIAREYSSGLHGIFLKHGKSSADFHYPFLNGLCRGKASPNEVKREQQKKDCLHQSIELVRKACEEEEIIFKATIYDEPSLDQLIAHSALADLMLLDASLNLKEYFISSINVCLNDILTNLHCPVKIFSGPRLSTKLSKVMV